MRTRIQCVWWNQLLTSATSRLNTRDHLRERFTGEKAENVFGLSSFRIAQGETTTDRSKSKPPAVSISMHHSETSDFPVVKQDRDVESSMAEMRRTVRSLCYFVALSLIKCCPPRRSTFPLKPIPTCSSRDYVCRGVVGMIAAQFSDIHWRCISKRNICRSRGRRPDHVLFLLWYNIFSPGGLDGIRLLDG